MINKIVPKLISFIIVILFLGSCIIPSFSSSENNINLSNNQNEQNSDGEFPPVEAWNKTFEENGDSHYIRQQSDDGYKIIANTFNFTYTNYVISFIKTDVNGTIEWKNAINLFENDDMDIGSIRATNDGGYFFHGNYGSYVGDIHMDYGLYVLKTDTNGNKEWKFTYDYEEHQSYLFIEKMKECPDGSFIISGMIKDFDDVDYDDGMILLKFNKYGYKEWDIIIPQANEEIKRIYPTNDGGCLLAGHLSKDSWIRKLDQYGNDEWESVFTEDHEGVREYVHYIHQASDDGYFIVVGTYNSNYFRIIKIDDSGNELSTQQFDDGDIFSIRKTNDNELIIFSKKSNMIKLICFNSTGSYEYLSSFEYIDVQEGWIYSKNIRETMDGGYILFIAGYYNGIWLIKIDHLGNKIYEKNFHLNRNWHHYFYCWDIDETTDNGYVITGTHVIVVDDYEWDYRKVWMMKFEENNPPSIPVIEGRTNIVINEKSVFSAYAIDMENDYISYLFDWGDGTNNNWTDYVRSANKVEVSHQWSEKESYHIRVKAKDEHGCESNWSDPLKITIPKSKSNFRIKFPSFISRFLEFDKDFFHFFSKTPIY